MATDEKQGIEALLSGSGQPEDLFRQVYGTSTSTPGYNNYSQNNNSNNYKPSTTTTNTKAAASKPKKKGGFGAMLKGWMGGEEAMPEVNLSGPTNFRKGIHVGFNPETGNFEVKLALF